MQRTIYHGSPQILRTPRFGSGTAANDYGLGFYCTDNPDLAAEWAVTRNTNGFVNQYTIETSGLRIINLNSPEYCILHWLAVLLSYREFDAGSSAVYQAKEYIRSNFAVDYQNCDCLVGFRGDDCNFWFAQSFLNGDISYRQLNDAVRLSDTGRQFVLKSNRAFDRVLFNGYSIAWSGESFHAGAARQRIAVQRFDAILRGKETALYVNQIVRENIKPYDPRLII